MTPSNQSQQSLSPERSPRSGLPRSLPVANIDKIPGLHRLIERTKGDERICVAVLDGAVDLTHPSLVGAKLTVHPVLGEGQATIGGAMSTHGTHVASVLFGQKETPVVGLAPNCRGVIIPVFSDRRAKVSQLDLARGIEAALEAGAHLINISGGQQIENSDEADEWLTRAVAQCRERNVLIVAAAGNNRCACLHAPAALSGVLAVGAMDDEGHPLEFSNWGDGYAEQGILAPGAEVLGAVPGGGTAQLSGTSFAAPIVTSVVALLLSIQLKEGRQPDPHAVRAALLAGGRACNLRIGQQAGQCLAGRLDVAAALEHLQLPVKDTMTTEPETITASCACDAPTFAASSNESEAASVFTFAGEAPAQFAPAAPAPVAPAVRAQAAAHSVFASQAGVSASQDLGLVYALGTLGYDFGTEARRDTFKQLMPPVKFGEVAVPANPYDARQMVDYLNTNPSESKALIWTLNLELTPIYAIEPLGPFGHHVYDVLRELLAGEVEAETAENFIQRVSVPGSVSGRTVRLFSGQVVPVIETGNVRGLYGWRTNALIGKALENISSEGMDEKRIRRSLDGFLNRVYYDLRNLGATSRDRALNFATTNAFQAASTFSMALGDGMELDSIGVEKSPVCRLDSDCWDVKLRFFDPENSRRAKRVFRFTIDVSDTIPVTLGEVRTWTEA